MDDKLKAAIDAMFKINNLITGGIPIPMGNKGATVTPSLPNYEDPRLTFKLPAQTPREPNVTFSLNVDLDWQKKLRESLGRLFP